LKNGARFKIWTDFSVPANLNASVCAELDVNEDASTATTPIPVLTATEERNEARNWRTVIISGEEKRVDMKVIEPYKRVSQVPAMLDLQI